MCCSLPIQISRKRSSFCISLQVALTKRSSIACIPSSLMKTLFFWVAKYMGYTEHVRPGRYVVHKGMNNLALVRMLRNRSQPIKVSFNNQERLPLLAARIAQEIEADSASLMKATLNPFFLYEHQMDSLNVLGLFIPNTYEFYWNTSAEEFVHRMGKEYKAFWNDSRRERADSWDFLPSRSPFLPLSYRRNRIG